MLQLQLKEVDIYQISKILMKYNIQASISNRVITLGDGISDDLLNELCSSLTICSVQNFCVEKLSEKQEQSVATAGKEIIKKVGFIPQMRKQYNLIYSKVKRGEVYFCDFGEPYGSEQGYKRYAIVIQNNEGNANSPTTIVLGCTTKNKKKSPVHYEFVFSDENMINYDEKRVGSFPNVVMAEQIRTIDKTRLRRFIGTMTPQFMDKLQEIIDISLHLKRTKN